MRLVPPLLSCSLALSLAAIALPAPRTARACGGCFAPTATVTNVESHRMVISLGLERTVLWDQIEYSGNPADFVWVLPVPTASVDIAVADAGFFDNLDVQTSPRVAPIPPNPPPCFGCCSGGAVADSAPEADTGVTVYGEEIVGPYETVTIGSESADALQNWLTDNGYNLPASTVPTIMHYVELGSVFVVLRLAPDQGVSAMQPVRISYPGYMANFPLEMVTIGASGVLGLSLWVIADQRYEALNYNTITLDHDEISYDWSSATTNYQQVFADSIEAAGGRAWVVEYAGNLSDLFIPSEELAFIAADLSTPFVTRLRTSMRVENFDADLVLAPANDASPLSNLITPGIELGRPGGDDAGCSASDRASGHVLLIAIVMMSLIGLRRRRRKGEAELA